MHSRRLAVAIAVLAAASLAPADTLAQGNDDHEVAEAITNQLEREGHANVAREAFANARAALERATRLRSAGDEAHAKAADGLAREWAEDARDAARAADAEAAAAQVRRKAVDAQAQLERTRALVEEAIARVGRLKAELDNIERSGATAAAGPASKPRRAVEVHAGEPAASAQSAPTAAPNKKGTADNKSAGARP
jgi:hypothetical protein